MQTPETLNNSNTREQFRQLLQREFVSRCERNPRFSIRAFAEQLGTNSGTLSAILTGKRKITDRTILQFGKILGVSPAQLRRHLNTTAVPQSTSLKTNSAVQIEFNHLSEDLFASISAWYHDAILELTRLPNFTSDTKWIAKALGITLGEARDALERLIRLELIEQLPSGRWKARDDNDTNILDPDFTTAALKKYQAKILDLSSTALAHVPRKLRDHTSTTIAVKRTDIPEVKEKN